MLILITGFIIENLIHEKRWKTSSVASVNGEVITVEEIMPGLSSHRAEILDYFYKKYGVIPDVDFWETRFEGEVPAEMLKKTALEECITIKVQQILAKEEGLIEDISYGKYLKDLYEENERRKIALEKNQIIYGPEQYTEDVYFKLLFMNMVNELRQKIDGKLICSEDDILKYYEEGKQSGNYTKTATTVIEKIAVKYSDDKSKVTAKEKADEIHRRFTDGEEFDDLSSYYSKDASIQIEFSEQVFDFKSQRNDYRPATYEFTGKALELQPDQISDVFELDHTYYVIKCTERTEEGFYTPEEAKDSIIEVLKDQKYSEYIDALVKEANVVIDQSIYKNLKIE